jgi:hypothetical protein
LRLGKAAFLANGQRRKKAKTGPFTATKRHLVVEVGNNSLMNSYLLFNLIIKYGCNKEIAAVFDYQAAYCMAP